MSGIYEKETLFDHIKGFKEVCSRLIEVAEKEEDKRALEEILYVGSYNGFNFCSNMCCYNSPLNFVKRNLSMACMYLQNKETFDYLVNNEITLFHGVNANALPSILESGLRSYDRLVEEGINVSTGENYSRRMQGRNFIGFTDVFDLAVDYSELFSKESRKDALTLGVVIGTTKSKLCESGRVTRVPSELPEIGIKDYYSLDSINVIGVPSDKLIFVRKLASNTNIKVLPMDTISDRLFHVDEDYMKVEINEKEFSKLKLELQGKEKKKSPRFSLKELYYLAITRNLTRIRKTIMKFKHIFDTEKKKEEEDNGRKAR